VQLLLGLELFCLLSTERHDHKLLL